MEKTYEFGGEKFKLKFKLKELSLKEADSIKGLLEFNEKDRVLTTENTAKLLSVILVSEEPLPDGFNFHEAKNGFTAGTEALRDFLGVNAEQESDIEKSSSILTSEPKK